MLQLQTVDEQQPGDLWARLQNALREDFARGFPDRSDQRCAGRITFVPLQDMHAVRRLANKQILEAYRLRRVERALHRGGPRPVTTVQRDRVEYRAFVGGEEGSETSLQPTPITVFVERSRPRNMVLSQELHKDYGFTRDGTLLGAVGEFRTWITLDERQAAATQPSAHA